MDERAIRIATFREALALIDDVDLFMDELEFRDEIREVINKRIAELEAGAGTAPNRQTMLADEDPTGMGKA